MDNGSYIRGSKLAQAAVAMFRPDLNVDGKWGSFSNKAYAGLSTNQRETVDISLRGFGFKVDDLMAYREAERKMEDKAPAGVGIPIATFAERAQKAGITGSSLVNLLANVEVESKFVSQRENHRYQPAIARENLRAFKGMTDVEISALVKRGPSAFFEAAYGRNTTVGKTLGNTADGDGGKYYGRGLIQLTGKYNYSEFAKEFPKYDVMSNPDVVCSDVEAAIDSAIWYWKRYVMQVGADRDIVKAAKAVNGGSNGLSERKIAATRFSKTYA